MRTPRRRRPAAAVRDLGRPAALLLGQLQRLFGHRPGVSPHRGRLREQQLQLPGAGEGAVLLGAAHRRGGHRHLSGRLHGGRDRPRQHLAARRISARRCRTDRDRRYLRAAGGAADLGADDHLRRSPAASRPTRSAAARRRRSRRPIPILSIARRPKSFARTSRSWSSTRPAGRTPAAAPAAPRRRPLDEVRRAGDGAIPGDPATQGRSTF